MSKLNKYIVILLFGQVNEFIKNILKELTIKKCFNNENLKSSKIGI